MFRTAVRPLCPSASAARKPLLWSQLDRAAGKRQRGCVGFCTSPRWSPPHIDLHPLATPGTAYSSRSGPCPSREQRRSASASPAASSSTAAVASLAGNSEELDLLACSDGIRLHAYSRHSCEPYQQSTIAVAGEKAVEGPADWDIRLVSAAGMKGSARSPNQDSFSFTHLTSGWFFCLACDGHGEEGEVIAERVSRTIPLLLTRCLEEAMSIEEALPQAFLEAQSDLERSFKIDQIYSGTTVVLCCIHLKNNEVFLAHTGDSRAVLGDLADARVLFSTEDHKAHDPPEYDRLKKCGAQVIRKKYDDGEIISRVFIPRTGVPGLAMSRSLGDGCLKKYGVIAEPEVNNLTGCWGECQAPAILAGSDGLWDTITVEDAIGAIAARHQKGVDIKLGAEVLCRRAQRMWIEAEDDYCDDVTVLIMAPQQKSS